MSKKDVYGYNASESITAQKIFNFVGKNKIVLEVGCASGSQSKVLKEQYKCVITGIEIDPGAAEEAKKYCNEIIVGDIGKVLLDENFTKRKFDIIIFADVLEHLLDPVDVLKRSKQVLSDDGYIVASIPNIVHASVIFEMIHGNFDYRETGLLDDTHVRFFTKKSIYQMFENAGLRITNTDRMIISPKDTEFTTTVIDKEDQHILEYIQKSNPENETYQFIIKAYKKREDGSSTFAALKEESLPRTKKIETLTAKIKRLESELQWITNKPAYKLYSRIRRFFKRS